MMSVRIVALAGGRPRVSILAPTAVFASCRYDRTSAFFSRKKQSTNSSDVILTLLPRISAAACALLPRAFQVRPTHGSAAKHQRLRRLRPLHPFVGPPSLSTCPYAY